MVLLLPVSDGSAEELLANSGTLRCFFKSSEACKDSSRGRWESGTSLWRAVMKTKTILGERDLIGVSTWQSQTKEQTLGEHCAAPQCSPCC